MWGTFGNSFKSLKIRGVYRNLTNSYDRTLAAIVNYFLRNSSSYAFDRALNGLMGIFCNSLLTLQFSGFKENNGWMIQQITHFSNLTKIQAKSKKNLNICKWLKKQVSFILSLYRKETRSRNLLTVLIPEISWFPSKAASHPTILSGNS